MRKQVYILGHGYSARKEPGVDFSCVIPKSGLLTSLPVIPGSGRVGSEKERPRDALDEILLDHYLSVCVEL